MSKGNAGFGTRVIGQDAYDKAVREKKGGADVFGVRVRGAIPADGPTNIAKRATEHGHRIVEGASFQDAKGRKVDGVAIEDLKSILAENPTFFDSLFEAELARVDGARPEAIKIFQTVESGIKGQGRRDVLDDCAALLGEKDVHGGNEADKNAAGREQAHRMIERTEQLTVNNTPEQSPLVETQEREIEEEQKDQQEGQGDKTEPQNPAAARRAEIEKVNAMTVAELEAYLGDEAKNVKGTGADDNVVRADLIRAARRHIAQANTQAK